MIDRIPEERRGGTSLVARPGAADGEVRAALLADQFAEAAFVADQVVRAHETGLPDGSWPEWRDVAVLVRSKRLLGPLREALEQRGVPVEVVGLSGLLETPEIVDLVSTLRVVADPGANVALARLLLGPRWRIGHRHLVRLARWAARNNWGLKDELPGEDPDPGDVSFALAEALDHLDEVEGLDEEARNRLDAFREELRELRAAARGPLLDLVQTILERTGVWAELEASRDRRATTARQNLATFLDRVAAFAPVQGDPSLAAFLVYLDAVEDASEPVEAVQPAPVDSVKLMTVHMAKGLEFPMVAVVGLSAGTGKDGSPRYGIFPDARVADPRRAQGFPYELREDAGHLPRFTGNARAFRGELEERALEDERRLFYVAITRAKQLLVLTSAWWYQGSEKTPKGPGPFWNEAAGHPAVDVLVRADQPAASPLTERLRERVSWPHPGRRPEDTDDPVFAEGLAEAVELERAAPGTLEARVPPGQADAFRAAAEAGRHLLDAARVDPTPARVEPPRILSVSQVLDYARCPRDFYWSVVRPLPSAPKPAARLGSVVHRLLERRARSLPDLLDTDDLTATARRPRRSRADRAGHPQLRGHPLRRPSPHPRPRSASSSASAPGWSGAASTPSSAPAPAALRRAGGRRGRAGGLEDRPAGRAGHGRAGPARHLRPGHAGAGRAPGGPLPRLLLLPRRGRAGHRHPHPRPGRPGPAARSPGGRPGRPREGRLPARLPPPRLRDLPPRPRHPTPPTVQWFRCGRGGGAPMTRPGDDDLRERLRRALPAAMKARDRPAVTALRSALAAIDNAEAFDPDEAAAEGLLDLLEPAGWEPADPADAVDAAHPGFAGTVAGAGATEVERRSLTPKQVEGIVRAEIETREEAATVLEGVGKHEHAERVRAEAKVLTSFLEPA